MSKQTLMGIVLDLDDALAQAYFELDNSVNYLNYQNSEIMLRKAYKDIEEANGRARYWKEKIFSN